MLSHSIKPLVGLLLAIAVDCSFSLKIIPKPLQQQQQEQSAAVAIAAAASVSESTRLVDVARDSLDDGVDEETVGILPLVAQSSSSSRRVQDDGSTSGSGSDTGSAASQNEVLRHSPHHNELLTTYDGSIKSTHGIEFIIENINTENQYSILSALGLNVGGGVDPTTRTPCRVKLYTKRINVSPTYIPNGLEEGYKLALDTTDVMCSPEGKETLITTEAFLRYYRKNNSDGVAEEEDDKSYPLVIPPNEAVSFYVIVLPVDESETTNPFTLISTSGTVDSAVYKSDVNVNLHQGSAVSNAYLVDDPNAAAAEVTKPTVFNGALYYDHLDMNVTSLPEYFDDLEYSLLPGDIHGIPGCDASVTTGYIDTIGSFGVMLDVSSAVPVEDENADPDEITSKYRDLEIYGMDVYIRNFVSTDIEIYARVDNEGNYMTYSPIEGQTKIVDNWELVAKGTLEGAGPDVGTPVPKEAWLKNVVLKPGQVAGFYVTVLNGPDLRYRESDLPEGSVYATDGILNVGVGRSWGEYPLRGDGSDVSFHPREFSGTFYYHAHEGVCTSNAPSVAATTSPAPSVTVANAYEDEEGMCPSENELSTTYQDTTGSYCILFDVSPKTDLTVTGLDLNVDWNSADQAETLVYARNGSWFGFQNDREAWPYIVANTTLVKPVGFHDRETEGPVIPLEERMTSAIIPRKDFKPLKMKEGETWAFYACISNADLRYVIGSSIGKVCASNSELRIYEGAGGADWRQFESEIKGTEYTFYAPRVPSVNLRYDYVAECPSHPPSSFDYTPSPTPIPTLTTIATFTFYAEHSADKSMADVTYDLEYGVRGTLDTFMKDKNNPLHEHKVNDGLVVISTRGIIVSAMDVGYLCIPEAPKTCTPVSIQVEVVHYESASEDEILYDLLSQSAQLQKEMKVEGYDVEYVGTRSVETDSEITLSGVPEREMGVTEQDYFAQVAKDFLNDQVESENDSLQILSVTVNGQEITADSSATTETASVPGVRRRLQSANRINVSVKGSFTPPPQIKFGEIVEKSINKDRDLLKKELTSKPPPTSVDGDLSDVSEFSDYFAKAEVVGARQLKKPDPEPARVFVPTSNDEGTGNSGLTNILNYASYAIGGLIVVLTSAFFLRPRRLKAMFGSRNDDYHMNTQPVDAEDNQMEALKAKSRRDLMGSDYESDYNYGTRSSLNYGQQQPSTRHVYSDQVNMSMPPRNIHQHQHSMRASSRY